MSASLSAPEVFENFAKSYEAKAPATAAVLRQCARDPVALDLVPAEPAWDVPHRLLAAVRLLAARGEVEDFEAASEPWAAFRTVLLERGGDESVRRAFAVAEQAKSRLLLEVLGGQVEPGQGEPDVSGSNRPAADPQEQQLVEAYGALRAELSGLYSRLGDDVAAGADASWHDAIVDREHRLEALESRLSTTRGAVAWTVCIVLAIWARSGRIPIACFLCCTSITSSACRGITITRSATSWTIANAAIPIRGITASPKSATTIRCGTRRGTIAVGCGRCRRRFA